MRNRNCLTVLFMLFCFYPYFASAEDCVWDIQNPLKTSGRCSVNGMATIAPRFTTNTLMARITNRTKNANDPYLVYESIGCIQRDTYPFCKSERSDGWSMTVTPIDLGNGEIGLLTAKHFFYIGGLNIAVTQKDAAIFLPGSFKLAGTLTQLHPVPLGETFTNDMPLALSADIRHKKENIPLQITFYPRILSFEGADMMLAPAPKGLDNAMGGISGATLLSSDGKIRGIFTGFLLGREPYAITTMIPVEKIHGLIEKAKKAPKGTKFVTLE